MDVERIEPDTGVLHVRTSDGELRRVRLVVAFNGTLRVAPAHDEGVHPSSDQDGHDAAQATRWSVDQPLG